MLENTSQPAFALPAPLPAPLTNPLASKPRVAPAEGVRRRRFAVAQRALRVPSATASGVPVSSEEGPSQPFTSPERDALLMDPDDQEFAAWAASAESEEAVLADDEAAIPLESLLGFEGPAERGIAELAEEEELHASAGFPDEDDEDEDEDDGNDDDDDDDDDDEDEDEELAARAGAEEFEEDMPVLSLSKRADRSSGPARVQQDGVDVDDNDEVADVEEAMEPVADDVPPVFSNDSKASDDDLEILAGSQLPVEPDDDTVVLFDDSDEDIRSAADILSSSGLLGLGVDGGKRADVSAVTSFALGTTETPEADISRAVPEDILSEDEDLVDEDEEGSGLEDEELLSGRGTGLESYKDDEEDDDDFYTLTSQSSVGRVWEMNDDNYVTITEAGQSYAYELDEEDEEDQEMSTMRRGKQGGWSGGLASYSSSQLPEGSKEWRARKAYELVMESNPSEMFRWTHRHQQPPPQIADLFPSDAPAPAKLARTRLHFSTPDSSTPTIGTDSSMPSEGSEEEPRVVGPLEALQDVNALERSVKFPCLFKFKVEGGLHEKEGDFERSLAAALETVLERPVSHAEFQIESAGRYKRVIMMVNVESAVQVTQVYDALRNNPAVKSSFG